MVKGAEGAEYSETVTAKIEEPEFPAASDAVQTTKLLPIGYILESMV
jgi:hypothetical protein